MEQFIYLYNWLMFYWVPIDWKVCIGDFAGNMTHNKLVTYARTTIESFGLKQNQIESTWRFSRISRRSLFNVEWDNTKKRQKIGHSLCRANLANKQQQRQRWIDWSGFSYIDCAFTCCCSIKWIMIIFMMLVNFTFFFQSFIFDAQCFGFVWFVLSFIPIFMHFVIV